MTGIQPLAALVAACLYAAAAVAAPTVYPTGTTIYAPERAWNGYTVFIGPGDLGAILIDMNGNTVKRWQGLHGAAGGPARVLPGGYLLGGGPNRAPYQESNALLQLDWDGNVVWQFDRLAQLRAADGATFWSARQHHDWQREGSPAGYYAPNAAPLTDRGRTLVLAHKNLSAPAVADVEVQDDYLVEISWDGEILWEWNASDHIDELGFSDDARAVIRAADGFNRARGSYDWLHVNSATYVGPNRWYDAGDTRFHPDNVIISSRHASLVAIVARDGAIAWRVGPDFSVDAATRELGQFIGQHHPHIIPEGLPGAGNMLVFDNGGASGYGFANPAAPSGVGALGRGSSRVVEFDPVSLETVWTYAMPGRESFKFFSHYISAAQRLANGNTMITEGADGRVFEVTADGEIVWEYVSPYFVDRETPSNSVYRAYRLPYNWVPQLDVPEQLAVVPPPLGEFRIAPQ
jgi:hypothetical protein